MTERDDRSLFQPRRHVGQSPERYRKSLNAELAKLLEFAKHLGDEYEWAYHAFHDRTVGEQAKTRSTSPSDPTASVVAAKHRARQELDRAWRDGPMALIRAQNALDARARNLEAAMDRAGKRRGAHFEPAVRGNARLPRLERQALAAAQARRERRGEGFGA